MADGRRNHHFRYLPYLAFVYWHDREVTAGRKRDSDVDSDVDVDVDIDVDVAR